MKLSGSNPALILFAANIVNNILYGLKRSVIDSKTKLSSTLVLIHIGIKQRLRMVHIALLVHKHTYFNTCFHRRKSYGLNIVNNI